MRIMLITDGSSGSDPTLLKKLEMACRAGVDAIQLREKNSPARELYHFAIKLRKLTAEWGVSLIINERLDLALAVKADGIHLPEHVPFLHTKLKIGRSIHSLDSALAAQHEGADYVLFGPIFPPLSKPCEKPFQGLDKLKEISSKLQIPVIAVGGVTPDNIPSLLQSGAMGVASISSLLQPPDVTAAVKAFQYHFLQKKQQVQGLHVILSSLPIAQIGIQGANVIQFRHKGTYTKNTLETAREIHLLCRAAKIPFIINDRCDIAAELDADGVHLGQSDLPIAAARKILGPNKIIGGTASTIEQALAVEACGADYVGFGHIFPTSSKQKNYPPLGLHLIRLLKEKLTIPLIAIGGISESNACSVLAQGADGIAVISAITQSSNPLNTVRKLRENYESICQTNVST